MPLNAVLFDKDGTLLDYAASWLPVNRAVASRVAKGDRQLADRLLAAGGMDPVTGAVTPGTPLAAGTNAEIGVAFATEMGFASREQIADVEALVEETFCSLGGDAATLVPGAAATCQRLIADGYRLGIATNDSADGIEVTLGGTGILDLMEFTTGWDSGFGGKPGPGMVHGFCDALGCQPGDVAVVGDSYHDLEMARAAGAGLKVGVLTGPSFERDLAPHADHVVASIADLPALLAQVRNSA